MRGAPAKLGSACFVRQWCIAPKVALETPHFTLHSSHFTRHTSHLHFTPHTSSHLLTPQLFSPHPISSHMSSKFFSIIFVSSEHCSKQFFYTQKALTHGKRLHTAIFYPEKLLHTASFYREAFRHTCLCTRKLLHGNFYTQKLLHRTFDILACAKHFPAAYLSIYPSNKRQPISRKIWQLATSVLANEEARMCTY